MPKSRDRYYQNKIIQFEYPFLKVNRDYCFKMYLHNLHWKYILPCLWQIAIKQLGRQVLLNGNDVHYGVAASFLYSFAWFAVRCALSVPGLPIEYFVPVPNPQQTDWPYLKIETTHDLISISFSTINSRIYLQVDYLLIFITCRQGNIKSNDLNYAHRRFVTLLP